MKREESKSDIRLSLQVLYVKMDLKSKSSPWYKAPYWKRIKLLTLIWLESHKDFSLLSCPTKKYILKNLEWKKYLWTNQINDWNDEEKYHFFDFYSIEVSY